MQFLAVIQQEHLTAKDAKEREGKILIRE